MEFSKKFKILFAIEALVVGFGLGCIAGTELYKYHSKHYVGTVVEKEYLPSEIKEETREEWHDGKLMEVKKPVRYEAQYNLILRDSESDRVCYPVTKEEFSNKNVGDRITR